jgi:RNA polymerase sigma factor (sigma-70 family)
MVPTMSPSDRGAVHNREAAPRSNRRDGGARSPLEPRRPNAPAAALRPPSDEALVASTRRGDRQAFDTLVARYQRRLFWFCWQIVRSREDVEDALQDVFTSAYNAILADDREIQVRPWLYRIARNQCINELRRRPAAVTDAIDPHQPDHGPSLVEKVVGRQGLRNLVSDVHALPDTQRTALLLCEIDGFSYQQIALAMSTTVPGVKSLLVRARLNLLRSAAGRDATTRDGTPAVKRVHTRQGPSPISYEAAREAAAGIT